MSPKRERGLFLLLASLVLLWCTSRMSADQTFAVALAEQEGPVTLGIFSGNGDRVRLLHRDAPVDSLPAGLNGLLISWDGRDDRGDLLPPGDYTVRGLVHGQIRMDLLPSSSDESAGEEALCGRTGFPDPSGTITLRAPRDALYEGRPEVTLRLILGEKDCRLEADGMPLAEFPIPSGSSHPILTHGPREGSALVTVTAPCAPGTATRLRWIIEGLERVVPLCPGTLSLPAAIPNP